MEQSFWFERWSEGRIGFHEQGGNRRLHEHWQAFVSRYGPKPASSPGRVLVPLCGKSTDLRWLAARGHEVVGVEFIEAAAEAFFRESGVEPERTQEAGAIRYRHRAISIIVADFFALPELTVGSIDLIYDRAALVAVAPERRAQYLEQLARLSQPQAGLFLATFEHDSGSGPPFSIADTPQLLSSHFDSVERIAEHDILEAEPRFRERGASSMLEVVWFARRLATPAPAT